MIEARVQEQGKKARDADRAPSAAERVLAHAQAGREIVQDFVPLADSLEWQLGQQYLRQRGNKAFLADASPVPFVVNNDGTLSCHAADVFFTSLLEADRAGTLEPDLYVLELGIGVGLFARFFLDHLRALCRQHKKDYYDRLCYVAADNSRRMLDDVLRHGVLAGHPGRYRVRLADALDPAPLLRDIAFGGAARRPLRAVFLNYLLDCLPAAVLELDGDQVRQLCVRTCVARTVRLADYTDLTPPQLRARAQAADPRARAELLEVYGLFASEYDYRPVDPRTLSYGEFAVAFGRTRTRRLLHSYGALQCLEKLLPLVAEGGFILANDYGPTRLADVEDFEHQRFSLATFVGVNFPLLQEYFGAGQRGRYVAPAGEEGKGIHARLLAPAAAPEVFVRFAERFGEAAHRTLQEPVAKARQCAQHGRFELAAGFYRAALHAQPHNWVLLAEVSQFLTFSLRDVKAGADLAKVALGLNPTCSAELCCTLGDALYEGGRTAEARSAYLKALAVNPADVRARYNLAWVHAREQDYAAALGRLAEGLALDKAGAYRERLLQKQQEVLARQAQRHGQEYLLLVNLVSQSARAERDGPAAPAEPPEPRRGGSGEVD